jgi:deoxyribodipyrimidine photo-lyase
MQEPIIYWFRNDLRLSDLPGLTRAAATGRPIVPCYILDDVSAGHWKMGGASRWWLHHSLTSLAGQIEDQGGQQHLASGDPVTVLTELAKKTGATDIYCSRQYEPWAGELEQRIHRHLDARAINFKRYHGSLLWEPERVRNKTDLPYKVFTPFWRNCLTLEPQPSVTKEIHSRNWHLNTEQGELLADLKLTPSNPDWAVGWSKIWNPGEQGANSQLSAFLQHKLDGYGPGRDFPSQASTSMLSAHLHFGEIAPTTVFQRTKDLIASEPSLSSDGEKFLSELGWREFSHHLMFHFPHICRSAFKPKFDHFPWVGSQENLQRWQQGITGYPIVDAGMRELWATGYMQNRVRMLAASFLCKHLLIDWRAGQSWFWDTLVDADIANNASGWQWVAGSGADASPYFRIFNPVTQAQKFDGTGEYIRQWVPELTQLPNKYIHEPWKAPIEILEQCDVQLGKTYPLPMVDHRYAREGAMAALGEINATK